MGLVFPLVFKAFKFLPPLLSLSPSPPNRGLLEVWKMLLQKTEEIAKARQTVSEMLLSQVSEDMRQQRRIKEQSFKRVSTSGWEIPNSWKLCDLYTIQ